MKKIILMFFVLTFMSCTKDAESDGVFNNPDWVKGTWRKDDTKDYLVFTNRDIVYNNSYSFSGESRKYIAANIHVITKNENVYVVDYFPNRNAIPIRFSFLRTSNTKMISKGYIPGNYTKQ